MNRKKKVMLGLIGLCCMGFSFSAGAAPVSTVAELTTNGGVVSTDATGAAVGGNALGISNSSTPGGFTYLGDVQINIEGVDLASGSLGSRTGINSNGSDMTLGKTTLTWRNDPANTASTLNIEGIYSINQSTVTLGDGSIIDIAANTSGSIDGVYAGGNMGVGSGKVDLRNQMTLIIKNDGNGFIYGIHSYDEGEITAGDHLSVDVTGGSGFTQGVVAGFSAALPPGSPGPIVNIGENARVIVDSTGNSAGIYAYGGGQITVQKDLTLRVNATGAVRGVTVQDAGTQVELNGADVTVSKNGVAGIGHVFYAANNATILGNQGIYRLEGDMASGNGGLIDMNFAQGSHFKGVSAVAAGGTTNFTMDGTTWNMTGDSTVSSLAFQGNTSNVIFDGTGGFNTLTVGDLSGDGQFTMGTDIVGDGNNQTERDFLHVTGTSAGNHAVVVQNSGSANATGDETLTIIRTEDGNAQFENRNVVELGGYEFNLRDVAGSGQKEWELFGTKKSTTPGSAAVNLFAGSYLLNYAETQTLMKRMGDLRDGKESGNVWGRIHGGKFHSNSDSFLKNFDMSYVGVQVGADKKFVREDGKGVVYLGGFFGYTKGDLDYGRGSGDVDSKSLGAYWTHMHHNGFYADAVFKYGWMKNDFDVLDSQGAKVTGDDISTRGFTGSLEVGRRYHFDRKDKDGWYVEPQAQLIVSHQNGDRFTASNGLNIKVDSFRSVMGRVGTHVGYEVKGGKNPINIYGKVSVVKEFDGEVNYSFNGSPETTSYKDTWVVYGIGATAKLGTRHNLYLDVERAIGGQFTQSWAVNGGYRYSW